METSFVVETRGDLQNTRQSFYSPLLNDDGRNEECVDFLVSLFHPAVAGRCGMHWDRHRICLHESKYTSYPFLVGHLFFRAPFLMLAQMSLRRRVGRPGAT